MNIFNYFKMAIQPIEGGSEVKTLEVADSHQTTTEDLAEPKTSGDTSAISAKSLEAGGDKINVHNLIILDESGSMESIYRPALSGVNETLQTIRSAQKEHEGQTYFVSLIAFDSGHYNQIYFNTPADQAVDITEEQYRPDGCTPLYDAMGRSINELRKDVSKGDVVLVTVITDGYENASREYNGKAIKSLVEAMKKEGWVFTYIGANQDVEAVAASMSIDNRLAFDADDESTGAMFGHERRSRKIFFSKLSRNMPMCDLSTGYFDDDDEEENGNNDKF